MAHLHFISENENDTARLGAALAALLPGGTVVALSGTLGAGKTRLVQAIAGTLGVDRRQVVSPTYVLIQEYHGQKAIYHFDAYRLRDDDEFLALGPDDYFESDGLVLIEWAERVADCLPRERLAIHIEVTGPTQRRFDISAVGEKYTSIIGKLAEMIG